MGCNRLCTPEDREAAALARSAHISFREAKERIISEKLRTAFENLAAADRAEAVKQIMIARDAAQRAAGFAITMVNRQQLGMDNNRKGDFGEGVTAIEMFRKGFEPVAFGGQGRTGIDSVWLSPTSGQYVVVESKYDTSTLKYVHSTPLVSEAHGFAQPTRVRQDSTEWTLGRLEKALDNNKALVNDMLQRGYDYAVSHSDRQGNEEFDIRRTDLIN